MLDRRDLLKALGASLPLSGMATSPLAAQSNALITKPIPKTGEMLPVIGMGTSRTFNVEGDYAAQAILDDVMEIFFDNGGAVIDSSPMYGASERIVGILMQRIKNGYKRLFAATKVWTDGAAAGVQQMTESFDMIGVDVMDLMQIHNLRDWKTHLPLLRDWKEEGKIRYIGITTSHGRFHDELAEIMSMEDLDFVQLSYSIDERRTEKRLLPLAQDRGIAVLANRPFSRGETFKKVADAPLPDWAGDIDAMSWAQIFLKFAASHPGVTCVIPATAKSHHALDNMKANFGRLPGAALRLEMAKHFDAL